MSERDHGIVPERTEADVAQGRQSRPALRFAGARPGDRLGDAWLRLGAVFAREMEAGRGFLWLPVLFGGGIVVYFALPAEPSAFALVLAALLLAVVAWRSRDRISVFRVLTAVTAVVTGVAVAKVRTDLVAAPALPREMTANVTGWVAEREAAARGGVRVLLRVRDMEHLASAATPDYVRITIRSKAEFDRCR